MNAASGHGMSMIYWTIFIIPFSVIGSNDFIKYVFAVYHGFLAFFGIVHCIFFRVGKITGTSDTICVLWPDEFIYKKLSLEIH